MYIVDYELEMNEILDSVDEADRSDFHEIKIAFLRNITLEPIAPFLDYFLLDQKVKSELYFCDYDNIIQEIIDKKSELYNFAPDYVVISLKLETYSEKLMKQFCSLSSEQISSETDRIKEHVFTILKGLRSKSGAYILLHNFEIPTTPSFGILDSQRENQQINTIRKLNLDLVQIVNEFEKTYLVDVDLLQMKSRGKQFFDYRYWHIGKAPYSQSAYILLANEYSKFIRAASGKVKKCLVLDLDNTLWGGIIGEDGISKIGIGKTYPGSAFREFQMAIMDFYQRGVILTICSKNNLADALEVFEKHPDMILRKKHFALIKANWNNKADNILAISQELNIGLDSMVFVDDNQFETNLVKDQIPEIDVIHLPKDPTKYPEIIKNIGCFDSLQFSEEDKKRTKMYQAESRRRELKTEIRNLDDYYRSLEMEVFINRGDDFATPRISQLSQRTNQFNLTTKRYSEADIATFIGSENFDVIFLRLKDKFGDSGIVGAAIIKYQEDVAHLDTFLLSCRIIGRGVEDIFLQSCLQLAKNHSCISLVGYYSRTKKNDQVADFYPKRLFEKQSEDEESGEYKFRVDSKMWSVPQYFKKIDINI